MSRKAKRKHTRIRRAEKSTFNETVWLDSEAAVCTEADEADADEFDCRIAVVPGVPGCCGTAGCGANNPVVPDAEICDIVNADADAGGSDTPASMPNVTNTPGTRRTPSVAYIGWETEYQRQYVWRQTDLNTVSLNLKMAKENNSKNGGPGRPASKLQPFNRNYAMPQDIIKPAPPPPMETPVNFRKSTVEDGEGGPSHHNDQNDSNFTDRTRNISYNDSGVYMKPGKDRYGIVDVARDLQMDQYGDQQDDDFIPSSYDDPRDLKRAGGQGSRFGRHVSPSRLHRRDTNSKNQQRRTTFREDYISEEDEEDDPVRMQDESTMTDSEDAAPNTRLNPFADPNANVKSGHSLNRNNALFSNDFDHQQQQKKTGKFDRSVVVSFENGAQPRAHQGSRPKSASRTPNIMAYGGGNTNPASDDQMMKSFNVKVPSSEQYPHTDDRTSRMKTYESERLRSPAHINNLNSTPPSLNSLQQQQPPSQQQQRGFQPANPHPPPQHSNPHLKRAQQLKLKKATEAPSTQQRVPQKSPFQAFVQAKSDALRASNTFVTEYQRQYTAPRQNIHLRVNGQGATSYNYVYRKNGASTQKPGSKEEEADPESLLFAERESGDQGSGGRYFMGHLAEGDETGGIIEIPTVAPPEQEPIYDTEDNEFPPERPKNYKTVKVGNRILTYNAEPPSTWNLAQDLLRRAQRQYAMHASEH
ncbi:hypothetical protein HDU77_005368 [Chytriomyces hyalinus]|nr:hypothetical protein HDU77_005368 [Chytriomyces hyalinus]